MFKFYTKCVLFQIYITLRHAHSRIWPFKWRIMHINVLVKLALLVYVISWYKMDNGRGLHALVTKPRRLCKQLPPNRYSCGWSCRLRKLQYHLLEFEYIKHSDSRYFWTCMQFVFLREWDIFPNNELKINDLHTDFFFWGGGGLIKISIKRKLLLISIFFKLKFI